MGLRRCMHVITHVLTLWALAICVLMLVMVAAQTTSLGIAKEERRLQELESNSGAETDPLNGNLARTTLYRFGERRNQKTLSLGRRLSLISRPLTPLELNFLIHNDDDQAKAKSYDYCSPMRLSKRGGDDQFDDYGHMRFGR
ncbi:drosulfakinins-like [Drosophila eugracilis]|uniref:drosulfakinins-like n=1 Tax=Drosophila eugracilis TaxID=29029 RepID=UPI001BDAB4EA|nr:drosulfakinins-like [Drosophila eugracilis]